ncbi:MAG TPA: cytochrome P450 [Pirellulales bacterium]|nr:cytochrome P450 [Pirellulales bacterium]
MTTTHPPGPRSLFGFHLARAMQRDVFGFSMDLARRYGDAAYFRIGPVRFFQFIHPDRVQEVLVKQAKKLHKPRRLKEVFGRWDGEGLLLSEGDLWVRQRRLVQQAFQPRRVEGYAAVMSQLASEMVARWQTRSEIDVVDQMHRATLDVVCKTLFGFTADDHAGIRDAVQDLQDAALIEFGRLVPMPDWMPLASKRRMRAAIRYMNHLLDDIIRQHRATGEDRGDLLSMLLLSVDHEGDGRGMSHQQVRDEAMTLLLAGHETTATTLVWTLYLLARHPQVQEQTATAVRDVLGDRLATAADVPRLAAVDCAIKEAMRLYPAVYFTAREAVEEVEIGGYRIPPGSQIHLLLYAIYHDPRWFPAPEEFLPARFADGGEERLPPGAFVPFGAGPRACIGRAMAMIEATLIVATILQKYRLSLAPGQGEPTPVAQVSLHPAGPVRLTLAPRETGTAERPAVASRSPQPQRA